MNAGICVPALSYGRVEMVASGRSYRGGIAFDGNLLQFQFRLVKSIVAKGSRGSRWFKQGGAVSAGSLGFVKRAIGSINDVIASVVGLCHADAACDRDRRFINRKTYGLYRSPKALGKCHRRSRGCVARQYHKLLAAISADDVLGSAQFLYGPSDTLKDFVAKPVPIVVVNQLEMVHVKHAACQRTRVAG